MFYYLHELTADVPEVTRDSSLNVLTVQGALGEPPYQILFNRDELLADETLPMSFDRQIEFLEENSQSFTIVYKKAVVIGVDKIEGFEIESSFVQSNKHYYQIQAMWVIHAPKIMVLTLSSALPISEAQRTAWRKLLESIKHRH